MYVNAPNKVAAPDILVQLGSDVSLHYAVAVDCRVQCTILAGSLQRHYETETRGYSQCRRRRRLTSGRWVDV